MEGALGTIIKIGTASSPETPPTQGGDQESMEVARLPASSLQSTCAEHLLAVLSEDVSTVALFLELQESRSVQMGRTPLEQGVPG